ncbi:MAG: DJ-1/PfpI family protein [Planctomycetota bacterium]|nr:DJ-1/PfpI family protein [Planctomycetota bacterium]
MVRLRNKKTFNQMFALIALPGVLFGLATIAGAQQEATSGEVYVCPPCGADCHLVSYDKPGVCPDPECEMTLVVQGAARNVAIVIWNGAEILDFAGPTEVFASARGPNGALFNVYTVAADENSIVSQGVVTIVPEYTIKNCPKPDIFVLPGGGTRSPLSNPDMIEWVRRTAEEAEIAMSVCTGAFVLGTAGLLDGKEATTYHGAIEGLRMIVPYTPVHDDQRWVDNGSVVTTAGVSAGIDGSLHVVSRLCGPDIARATAEYMEYNWNPDEITGLIASPGTEKQFTLGQKIIQKLLEEGVTAAMEQYRAALDTTDEVGLPSEAAMNRLGYQYVGQRDLETAIRIFNFNVEAHPDAFNAWDSLAEACMLDDQKEKAIRYYRKSLELNPENSGAKRMLEKLLAD